MKKSVMFLFVISISFALGAVLRDRLKGKTKSEVRRLVGNSDRIEVFAGKKCWVYGNTYTSKDRVIWGTSWTKWTFVYHSTVAKST